MDFRARVTTRFLSCNQADLLCRRINQLRVLDPFPRIDVLITILVNLGTIITLE